MTSRLRPRLALAFLTATILISVVATTADAGMPRARHYRVGGPITLDTNLRSVSGVSVWAINEYLAATTPLPALGAAFLAAEKKYRVNARFLLAAALHESAWGTSYISRVKHNLFGFNAYDRDPLRYASAYGTYAANVDATARFIAASYLTPGGRWWGGAPTLRSMQQFWSSSGSWGTGVSRIASSVHLGSIAGRRIRFAAPVVSGTLHGGDRTTVQLAWSGGAIPAGVEFLATWEPTELDSEVVAATVARPAAADAAEEAAAADAVGAVDTGAAAAAAAVSANPDVASASAARLYGAPNAAVTAAAPKPGVPSRVDARRARTGTRSITLAIAAPREPGRYMLAVQALDSGRRALPARDQVDIPSVEVRVWGDVAVRYDLEPGPDGTGAIVRVTNTGRVAIPAVPALAPSVTSDYEAQAVRSTITVTASAADVARPRTVLLVASPLAADLAPGASVTVDVPGIRAATGRATNWLSVNLGVLGDPTWLAAYSSDGAWFSDAGAAVPAATGTPVPGEAVTPAPSHAPVPSATPAPTPGPTTKPTPAPRATPVATPEPTATPAPSVTPAPSITPKPSATPAPRHVTRIYTEHSGAIVYRGGWGTAPFPGYIGGNVTWARTPGATAAFTFTGTSVRWIGPVGPTRGRALVLIDGRAVATVNLYRSTFVARAVLFRRTFHRSGRHTLTIKVLSSSHPTVAIDGFVVRS